MRLQIKQGLDPDVAEADEAAARRAAADAAGRSSGKRTRQLLLLRLWGLMMAITHRTFGARFGGDAGGFIAQWQASLDAGMLVKAFLPSKSSACTRNAVWNDCKIGWIDLVSWQLAATFLCAPVLTLSRGFLSHVRHSIGLHMPLVGVKDVKSAMINHAFTQQWQAATGGALAAARSELASMAAAAQAQVQSELCKTLVWFAVRQ